MKLSTIKELLPSLNSLSFRLENNTTVPAHFHVTEVGSIHKHFIDCGGKVRREHKVSFQLWNANDIDHKLQPEKLLHIIDIAENEIGLPDEEIEVEYQGETIGKYDLDYDHKAGTFLLKNRQTACLAEDSCGIPSKKKKIKLGADTGCSPNSGCC